MTCIDALRIIAPARVKEARMGLLDALGLRPAPARPGDSSADASAGGADDPVLAAHDAIAALLDKLPDDKVRDGFESELASLRARHAKRAEPERAAARKGELAQALALRTKVKVLADQVDLALELEQARSLVDTGLSAINALVLGGIGDDALRSAVNGRLSKLKASQVSAVKLKDPRTALTGFAALLVPVRALQNDAEHARDASRISADEIVPMVASARAAIGKVTGPALTKLATTLDALDAARARALAAMDAAALTETVAPQVAQVLDVATRLPPALAKVDAALSRAASLLGKLDGEAADAAKVRLKALQDERAGDWPTGSRIEEMAASFARVESGAAAVAAEAEALGPKIQRQREIAALRKRLDALKPRLDRAAAAPEAAFLVSLQKRVTDALANFTKFESSADLKSCEVLFSQIGAGLDMLDTVRDLLVGVRGRLAAAKNGGIKASLAVKLTPAALAALRSKALDAKEKDIEAMVDGGNFVAADSAIENWLASARTWSDAPDAYANLRSGKPKKAVMQALIGKPGGGQVFDALIADLPEGKTAADSVTSDTMTTALEARFGCKVSQFDHRTAGEDFAENDAAHATSRTATNPKAPQKGLKDLYRVLRSVPVKDVSYTEEIVDYEEDGGGAFYQGTKRWGTGGSRKDKIVMYVGRPDRPDDMVLGGTQAPGQTADPAAQPADSQPVNAYSQSALHEVGHGLDDARNVMAAHMDEAGWQTWTAAQVAAKVAAFHSYDAGYVEALMKGTTPAAKPPRPKAVATDEAWAAGRADVEQWVAQSLVAAKPWNDAGHAKANAIGGRVFHESMPGEWVSYHLAARARGIRAYQFRSPAEWFAELYAAYHLGKLKPSHPSVPWLSKLNAESQAMAG